MSRYYAYCYKSGEIGFTSLREKLPDGAVFFAKGEGYAFRQKIEKCARLSKDGKTLFCPGLPEKLYQNFLIWHEWNFPNQAEYRAEIRDQIIRENHGTENWRDYWGKVKAA